MCPPIFSFVPNANLAGAATVLPGVAIVPEAVLPVAEPQHLAHEQYAVTSYISPPTGAAVLIVDALAVTIAFLFT